MGRSLRIRLITSVVLVGVFLAGAASLALAQDTSKLVTERCTECHKADRWQGKKNTEKQWAKIVDQMIRYGAQLDNDESALVVEYLAAMSSGKIKQPTTTVSTVKLKTTTSVRKIGDNAINAIKTAAATTTTLPATAATTVAGSTVATNPDGTPVEQAQTGVEMVWYLLGGGVLIGSGMSLRNRERRVEKQE